MTERPTGVLVMAHGTPATRDGIESFYTSIRRGRPPTPELLADLVERYDAIGGTSPLREHTDAQVAGLAATLDTAAPGRFAVRYGAKHTAPSIEEGVAELAEAGVTRVVGLVLTPHQSAAGHRSVPRAGGSGRIVDRTADRAHCRSQLVSGTRLHRHPRPTDTGPARIGARARPCPLRGDLHRPQRALPGHRRRRPLRRRGDGVGQGDRRPRRARALAGGMAERGADGGRLAGARLCSMAYARSPPTAHPPWWCARWGSWPTIWRFCTTSTSKRRRWRRRLAFASPAPRP